MDEKSVILTVLGSGTAVPHEGRTSASYLLQVGQKNLLLDAGFSVVSRLDEAGISIESLDGIFISHKHPDHFMGLIHILFALKNPIYQRQKPLHIFGFEGLADYLAGFDDVLANWIQPECGYEVSESVDGHVAGVSYALFKTDHSTESVGISLTVADKKMIYTGDTAYTDDLVPLCMDADLVIADCAGHPEKPLPGHMHYEEIVKLSEQASIKNTLFSHFYPGADQFDVPFPKTACKYFMARDLIKITV